MGQIRFLGWAVIAGALAILVFNGVTLWHSAYDLNAKFPALAAWSVIGMLAIECLGLGIAMLLAKHKQRLMALAATVLTIVMAGYLLRLDLNFNVTGRSDREAQRELSIQERKSDQSELERQIKLRDALQGEKRLTEDQRDTLYEVRQRIKALEARWGAHETAPAEKAPEASWLSRWLGVDLQSADDFMQAMPVFANFLARLLCLPIGLSILSISAPQRQEEAAEAEAEAELQPKNGEARPRPKVEVKTPPPAEPGQRLGPYGRTLNESAGVRMPAVYSAPVVLPAVAEAASGPVEAFIDECLEPAAGHSLKSTVAFKAYQKWAERREVKPLSHPRFGEAFKAATGEESQSKRDGAYYRGWRLRTEIGRGEAGRSARENAAALSALN